MAKNKWFWLQLFGGEGGGAGAGAGASGGEGGGDSAVTGENNGLAAEDQRLLELGVPEEKLRKRAKRANAKLPEGAVRTAPKQAQEQQPQEQVATAEETPTEEKTETPATTRMSWEEIMADPEYNKQMQATIKARLKTAGAAEEAMTKLEPALEVLALKFGLDPANIDYETLAKKIGDKKSFIEDKALDEGKSFNDTEREVNDALDRARQTKAETRERETLEQQMFDNHIRNLDQQGEALKKIFPKFDLRKELQNPVFARMVAPGKGIMSVEDAYRAVHRQEIEAASMQVIAQKTAEKMSNAIQAGSRRPNENGTSGQSASVTTFDYSKASKEQRDALKRQIYAAKARGEKLYPGR